MGRSRQKTAACSKAQRNKVAAMVRSRMEKRNALSAEQPILASPPTTTAPASATAMPSTSTTATLPASATSVPSATATPSPSATATPSPSATATPSSTSKRKLAFFSDCQPVQPVAATLPTTVVDLNCLQPLFASATCSFCKSQSLQLQEGSGSKAFIVSLELLCTTCGEVNSTALTSPMSGKMGVMNRTVVATGLTCGVSHAGIQKLSEGLGMRGMHYTSYQQHIDEIFLKVPAVADVILTLSRQKVQEFYRQHFPDCIDGEGVLSIPVSFYGSWPKRGHTSKLGFGAAIEVRTGLVVDFHVLSMHCQRCSTMTARLNGNEAALNAWKEAHTNCLRNYQGSSGAMEVEAALVMWRRSVNHNMRYTTMVGDGDTKTFLAITKERPYGDIEVTKEECVNHVSKRLNTGLRNLKTTLGKQSIRIGGNAKGSLSDPKIGLLQLCYTKAVRSNDTVESMSRAIWAAYHHSTGVHDDCPPGEQSWCWFQRDIAAGIEEPQAGTRKQSTFLNELVAGHVKAVYQRLTDPALLSCCLLGVTQNSNESLHSLIWQRCPKHLWSGYKKVYIASLLGVGEYNMGSLASRIFLDGVGCTMTEVSAVLGEKRDRKRVAKSEYVAQESVKKRREVIKLAQQTEQARHEEREGGASYISGGF